jgi:hypothetical protein
MKKIYLNEKEFHVVMCKLFQSVGKKFTSVQKDCRGEDWFRKYKWTEQEELAFKKWLVGYIVERTEQPKKMALKQASHFIFQYGWSLISNTRQARPGPK